MLEIHKEWLKAANDDLILLEDIKNNQAITNLIAFHSQQTIEKSLKAYLEYKSITFKKIHKIQSLIDLTDLDLAEYDDMMQTLDALYIESRYPGDMGLLPYGKPTIDDAKEFYNIAKIVFNLINNKLDIN